MSWHRRSLIPNWGGFSTPSPQTRLLHCSLFAIQTAWPVPFIFITLGSLSNAATAPQTCLYWPSSLTLGNTFTFCVRNLFWGNKFGNNSFQMLLVIYFNYVWEHPMINSKLSFTNSKFTMHFYWIIIFNWFFLENK